MRTFVQTQQATCAGVRAGSCAGNCAGASSGRARAVGRPNAGMAFRYWAWPATFHIGRRGAAALAHLLQRPVWPMQQLPSSASTWSMASTCLPALPALAQCAFDGTLRSTSPSRCTCSSASRRFDRCPSCPSSSTTTSTRCTRWQLLHWPHRPLQQMRDRGRASPANVKSGWPGPNPKGHACIGPPHSPRPARTRARTIARTTARTHARTRRLCVCTNVRAFSPQVRVHARAVRRVDRTV